MNNQQFFCSNGPHEILTGVLSTWLIDLKVTFISILFYVVLDAFIF